MNQFCEKGSVKCGNVVNLKFKKCLNQILTLVTRMSSQIVESLIKGTPNHSIKKVILFPRSVLFEQFQFFPLCNWASDKVRRAANVQSQFNQTGFGGLNPVGWDYTSGRHKFVLAQKNNNFVMREYLYVISGTLCKTLYLNNVKSWLILRYYRR